MSLQGKVVLVTGGTRGIGRSIALRLGRERPLQVVCAYSSNHEAARKTIADLRELGVAATAVATDVGSADAMEALFRGIEEQHGRLDIFVSNAARTAFRPALELTQRTWSRIMEINAQAFLLGAQHAGRLMQRGGGGRIVAISSLGSRLCTPQYAGLGTSKAAIESLVRYFGCELAPHGINVNAVCGGYIDTEAVRQRPDYEELNRHVLGRTPAGRLGTPEDIAGVVAFLCSPESEWIRGQTLVADGGFSLTM